MVSQSSQAPPPAAPYGMRSECSATMAQLPAKSALAPGSASPDLHTPTLKVVLLGDLGVGKTCLRSQLVHHIFSGAYKATVGADFLTTTLWIPDPQARETGAEHMKSSGTDEPDVAANQSGSGAALEPSAHGKDQVYDTLDAGAAKKVCLQIWDTAGQERFNSISQAFYRGADVAVFVYDITNYESLLSVREWFARFMTHCKVTAPAIVIVGNKLDKSVDRSVELAEVRDILCRRTNLQAAPLDGHVDWHLDIMEASAKDLHTVEAVFRRAAWLSCSRDTTDQQLLKEDLIDLNGFPKLSSCAC